MFNLAWFGNKIETRIETSVLALAYHVSILACNRDLDLERRRDDV